jgi:pilus assembly protein Flp/PilA
MKTLLRFLRAEEGPTAVEYAVMLAMIILVCIAAVQAVGTQTGTSFSNSATSIGDAMGAS